jgi:hypothetical protein
MKNFAWSYSRLKNFETCPKRHFHYDIAKDVQETGGFSEGMEMHRAFEARVSTGTKLPLPYSQHEAWITQLISAPGETYAEQKLALDKDFKPASWRGNAWFRAVIDFCKVRPESIVIVDYKSGKPIEDDTQLALQAATVLHHLGDAVRVKSAFLFTGYDRLISHVYTREDIPRIWSQVLPRVRKLEKAMEMQDYPPKPSGLCVKYCSVTHCPYHGVGSR